MKAVRFSIVWTWGGVGVEARVELGKEVTAYESLISVFIFVRLI